MSFHERLRKRDLLLGTLLGLGSPEAAEILSRSGFDWFFIDLEHSAMGPTEGQRLLQAIGDRAAALVRVESRSELGIRKALDMGAAGIIVPQVNSREDAEAAVSLAHYPPLGTRSVGLGRACNFGTNFSDYMKSAAETSLVVLQIEHIKGVEAIEEIAAVKGVDALFVGPYDLSGSVGQPGAVEAPQVLQAIERVRNVAASKNIPLGIFCASAASASRFIAEGFSLITVATEGMLLARGAAAELNVLRG